jgi:hypothetical protein
LEGGEGGWRIVIPMPEALNAKHIFILPIQKVKMKFTIFLDVCYKKLILDRQIKIP